MSSSGTKDASSGISPEQLAHFRNLLSLDKECNWFYDGEPITHERTLEVLSQSLSRNGEGRLIVQIGDAWSYVRTEDCPYCVRAVRESGDPPAKIDLLLSDGTSEALDPSTLAVSSENVLYCRVKGGKEEARFLRPAYYELSRHIVSKGEDSFALRMAGGAYPIGERRRPS
ncbi:MAG: hypothetical protein AB1405_07320 [Bdellovibrionota bacterium]